LLALHGPQPISKAEETRLGERVDGPHGRSVEPADDRYPVEHGEGERARAERRNSEFAGRGPSHGVGKARPSSRTAGAQRRGLLGARPTWPLPRSGGGASIRPNGRSATEGLPGARIASMRLGDWARAYGAVSHPPLRPRRTPPLRPSIRSIASPPPSAGETKNRGVHESEDALG
jgi:hypothetical protein